MKIGFSSLDSTGKQAESEQLADEQRVLTKSQRPLVLGGITVKVVTGCGNMYIQLNWYQNRLFEVFATLGRGGGCAICQSEALTRGITLGLKYGIPVSDYVRQLRGIRCPTPVPFPKEHAVLSCPDAIAKTLEVYGGLGVGQVIELIQRPNSVVAEQAGDRDEEAEASEQVRELGRVREAQELNG